MSNYAPRAHGFTLIELVVVIAVAAVLLGIAVPSFRTFNQNSRLATQANSLVYALNLARSQAVSLDQPVQVCASSDGATCNAPAAGWVAGWIVCYPVAACGAGGATLVQVSPALGGGNTLTEQIGGVLAVTYLASGQTSNGPGGASYRFAFCDARGAAFAQDVEINPIGRIESGPTQGQTVSGAALACP
jgi:type IV fimbrial biogenesis protein FimT